MALHPQYVTKKVIKNSKFYGNSAIYGQRKKRKKVRMLSKKYSKYETGE